MKRPNTAAGRGADRHVDWGALRERLDAVRLAIERGRSPDPEESKAILESRARALARETTPAADHDERIEVVEFELARETYALDARYVREIYPLRDLTPLPGTPAYVLGIINLRGQILSVLDLRQFFDLPRRGLTDLNKVIVLRSRAMEFGVLADAIVGTRMLPLRQLQPSLPTLTGIREQYLKGIDTDRSIVLDAEKLLSDDKLVINEHVNR